MFKFVQNGKIGAKMAGTDQMSAPLGAPPSQMVQEMTLPLFPFARHLCNEIIVTSSSDMTMSSF
jgi:hypothetical protein